jgi:hypothetical protein
VTRLPRYVLVGVVVVLGVSACTGSGDDASAGSKTTHSPGPSSIAAPSVAARPQVGNCYRASGAAFRRQRDGSEPVGCHKRHTDETFAVFSAGGAPPRAAIQRVWRQCEGRFRSYVGDSVTVSVLKVIVMLPSKQQIAAGQGWIRCDAIQPPNYAGHSGLPRKGSVKRVLSDRVPKALRGCVRHWPKIEQGVHFTSCRRHHQAELLPVSKNLGHAEAPYPGRRSVKTASRRFCAGVVQHFVPQTRHFYYYYPTPSSWRSSTHNTTCWALDPKGDGLPPI